MRQCRRKKPINFDSWCPRAVRRCQIVFSDEEIVRDVFPVMSHRFIVRVECLQFPRLSHTTSRIRCRRCFAPLAPSSVWDTKCNSPVSLFQFVFLLSRERATFPIPIN
jgi:hypothetical protein